MNEAKRKEREEDYINKCILVHNNRYDYSLVKYISAQKDIEIVCKDHGTFWQRAGRHLTGSGCPLCARKFIGTATASYASENFVDRAKKLHGNKYDYSLVSYKNNEDPLILICPLHGEFKVRPQYHISSKEEHCPACVQDFKNKVSQDFLEMLIKDHGEVYEYLDYYYTNSKTRLTFICPVHGKVEQNAHEHLKYGCPSCHISVRNVRNRYTQEEFLAKARESHGDKYDYSKMVYDGMVNNILITCPIHGDFQQNASSHIKGSQCPLCRTSSQKFTYFDRCKDLGFADSPGCFYILHLSKNGESFGKIGVSINYKHRISSYKYEGLEGGEVLKLEMTALESAELEEIVLDYIACYDLHYSPSFSFSGRTECFDLMYLSEVKKFAEINHERSWEKETEFLTYID